MKKHPGISIRKHAASAALTLALLLPAAVYALSVGEGKREGLVTETSSGYLQAVPAKRTADVDRLVSKTNAARKAEYRDIAKRLNVDLSVVEKDFGKKLRGR